MRVINITFLIIVVFLAGVLMAADAPRREAESRSIEIADQKAEETLGLSKQEIAKEYECELFFYSSLRGPNNFGRLTDQDVKELEPKLGEKGFFLHRYSSREKMEVIEIFVSEDGGKILSGRRYPIRLSDEEKKGAADALADFRKGVYFYEVYGLIRGGPGKGQLFLEEKYQVRPNVVAGCIVNQKILDHAEGYNSKMQELLKQRYKKDIFKEAAELEKEPAEPTP